MLSALEILGVKDHRYLGEAGARWPENPPRNYSDTAVHSEGDAAAVSAEIAGDALTAAPFGEVAADIAAVIADVAPTVVVSYNEWGGSGHPDHIRAHQSARRAAEVMGVAFYVIEPDGSAATSTVTVNSPTDLALKSQALTAYDGTLSAAGDSVTFANGEISPVDVTENFRRLRPVAESSGEFRELGWVAKAFAVTFAGIVGGLAGLLLTAIHQWTVSVLGSDFPAGLAIAMLASTALIVGLRVTGDTRVLPAVAGALLLTATALLAFPTSGGSIIVPANFAGYVWSFGPAVVTLLVLAWPRVQRPAAGKISVVPAVKGSSIP
jgi:N-acetyl-1-D-myo-inositol-2-amino-2-deoxy-alpha-D-glucopyranoside deacetylase